ncbi:hypothetical protein PCASD_23129 [Puccinia coronata f. sp. avenae]|uniref:Uncharacterized protein n=1 Tax=Puccinia coronata f. sp. avenae TaxID=200324 RepID=A0A2N5SAG2_9BASI|nr:hypothetical protein PCASD_23129 [Puccinia coronata f. sp. avenae]
MIDVHASQSDHVPDCGALVHLPPMLPIITGGTHVLTNGASRLGVGYDHRRGEEGVGRTKKTLTLLEQHARLRAIWKEHNAANHAAASSSSSSSSSRPVFY